MREPNPNQAAHYLNILRDARAVALQDAEGFHALFQAFESLGQFLNAKKENGLYGYKKALRGFMVSQKANEKALERFDFLFSIVHQSRNSAVHEGTYARTLTQHAIDFALILELALMNMLETVEQYMISHPITVEPWQTLRYARQLMLRNSFSFLPIKIANKWQILADFEIVNYLKPFKGTTRSEIDAAFDSSLEDAIKSDGVANSLKVHDVKNISPKALVNDLPETLGMPLLVLQKETLVGIITPFDLL